MTYKVSSGTLNLCSLTVFTLCTAQHCSACGSMWKSNILNGVDAFCTTVRSSSWLRLYPCNNNNGFYLYCSTNAGLHNICHTGQCIYITQIII